MRGEWQNSFAFRCSAVITFKCALITKADWLEEEESSFGMVRFQPVGCYGSGTRKGRTSYDLVWVRSLGYSAGLPIRSRVSQAEA